VNSRPHKLLLGCLILQLVVSQASDCDDGMTAFIPPQNSADPNVDGRKPETITAFAWTERRGLIPDPRCGLRVELPGVKIPNRADDKTMNHCEYSVAGENQDWARVAAGHPRLVAWIATVNGMGMQTKDFIDRST
jgi:hypothetical protein